MKRVYSKTVSELFREFVSEQKIGKEDTIDRKDIYRWFRKYYPKILESTIGCQIIKHTTNAPSRFHYRASKAHDLLFQIDKERFRLYNTGKDPFPVYKRTESPVPGGSDGEGGHGNEDDREFAYEKDLQQFLSKNLDIIEKGLELYVDPEDEAITGIEFPCGQKFIDILAVDKDSNFVVIELKVSKGYERVIGQLARYIAWVKKNVARDGKKVRGVVIAREISEDLKLAASEINNIQLFEYELNQ